MVSDYYKGFLREIIKNDKYADICIGWIQRAFLLSTHLVRVRSVARSAGFCAFYGRMAEKMGVYEVIESSSIVKGRDVHRLLSLASLDLFMNNPLIDMNPGKKEVEERIKESVKTAYNELKGLLDVDISDKSINIAETLLRRLINALNKAKNLIGLINEEPLFPIVEQQFADYETRMFGAPDLILENKRGDKAIVVEWKTYTPGGKHTNSPSKYEMAQVVAYSILEARRLGKTKLEEIFESISGIKLIELLELIKLYETQGIVKSFEPNVVISKGLLRVLPLIVTPSGGYPPHPLMYKEGSYDKKKVIERFKRLYDIFIRIVVAAEHLALQIMNVPDLLEKLNYRGREVIEACSTKEGYQAYGYTPFKYLRCGKPGAWNRYPCRACGFKGNKGPCEFYFDKRKPKDYFDKLMWWARFRVYSLRERDLVSHRAMYELFETSSILDKLLSSEEPLEFEIDLGQISNQYVCPRNDSECVVNMVRVKRGKEDLGKFRFDYFGISDVEFYRENNIIVLKRKLRAIEKKNNVVGFLRRSIYLSIIEPDKKTNPLLSINTFVMIDSASISEDDNYVIYECRSPSPVLMLNLILFSKYVEIYKRHNPNAFILAYETPVDLTIMELRAIDSLHRYLKEVNDNADKILEMLKKYDVTGVEKHDLIDELNIMKQYVPKLEENCDATVFQLYRILREKIIRTGVKDG
ncbi:MAG: PD-(D/E)XK nuclease family protein [Thermosphaera sp.]